MTDQNRTAETEQARDLVATFQLSGTRAIQACISSACRQ